MSDKSLLSKTEREKTQISGQTGVGWISTSKIQYLYANEYRLNHLEIWLWFKVELSHLCQTRTWTIFAAEMDKKEMDKKEMDKKRSKWSKMPVLHWGPKGVAPSPSPESHGQIKKWSQNENEICSTKLNQIDWFNLEQESWQDLKNNPMWFQLALYVYKYSEGQPVLGGNDDDVQQGGRGVRWDEEVQKRGHTRAMEPSVAPATPFSTHRCICHTSALVPHIHLLLLLLVLVLEYPIPLCHKKSPWQYLGNQEVS